MDGTTSEEDESVQLNGAKDGKRATVIVPRSARKHSHSRPMPHIEMSEYNWKKTEVSPSGSIRRKFVFTVPGVMKQHQPREYKLKAFVVFLFFLITIYVALTYVFHKQQELHLVQIEIAEGIRFQEKSRVLRILNHQKQDVLRGQLGRNLHSSLLPYDCLFPGSHDSRCFKWKDTARLHIAHLKVSAIGGNSDPTRCYSIIWESLSAAYKPLDCFSMENLWFGVGEMHEAPWPINTQQTSTLPFYTGSGNKTYGSILQKYWLSSKAVALIVDNSAPLIVGIGDELCFGTDGQQPNENNASLSYKICIGEDLKSLHSFVSESMKPKPVITPTAASLVEGIVWTTDAIGSRITREALFKFADDILDFGHSTAGPGIIVITRDWQKEDGDLTFDEERFPDVKEMLTTIHNKGFKIALTVHPYVSTGSVNYMKGVINGLWINDESNTVPALTRWHGLRSAATFDFTNDNASAWFLLHLNKFHDDGVDGFVFDGGESMHQPRSIITRIPFKDPDTYLRTYTSVALDSGLAFSLSSSAGLQVNQTFVTISPRSSDWSRTQGLGSVIPTVLSVGLAGYPFVNPGLVGGSGHPDSELFIRWLQMSIFLPVLQMSVSPKNYSNEIVEAAKSLLNLRRDVALPALQSSMQKAAQHHLPLIRPLWWLAPNDTAALKVVDQFAVGDDLIVAPILTSESEYRDIYLPPGLWNQSIQNKIVNGPTTLYRVEIPLYQVQYFTRFAG